MNHDHDNNLQRLKYRYRDIKAPMDFSVEAIRSAATSTNKHWLMQPGLAIAASVVCVFTIIILMQNQHNGFDQQSDFPTLGSLTDSEWNIPTTLSGNTSTLPDIGSIPSIPDLNTINHHSPAQQDSKHNPDNIDTTQLS